MNTKAYMVIIKGEIRTSEVQSCQYDHLTNKWDVTFRKGKTYSYSCENIEFLKNPALLEEHERKYAMNPATHIDFLIYNRISKKPVLAIEVDGYAFHKEGTDQRSRDALKDHILELYEIPLLRFGTNGSGEKEKMMAKLDEMMDGGNLS